MRLKEIESWLRERDPVRLDELWRRADEVRREAVGDGVHLRALVEVSNHCVESCHYCGLRAGNRRVPRYRMSSEEILACAGRAAALGFGTLVLQAGTDPGLRAGWVAELVRRVKGEHGLAVTLSLGERAEEELAAWREAGAERYLLRFETSNAALYRRVHPDRPGRPSDRLRQLRRLRELGYEVGTGMLVGLPGQTWPDLAADLLLLAELEADMIGLGPFVPHPDTPLGAPSAAAGVEVPADVETACKSVALARLLCPLSNIPATTALATLDPAAGRSAALRRGANVLMPNLTPPAYRRLYEIYPGKASLPAEGEQDLAALAAELARLGRVVAAGPGTSAAFTRRALGAAPTPIDVAPGGAGGAP
jgi:biotin synthase